MKHPQNTRKKLKKKDTKLNILKQSAEHHVDDFKTKD
jgi:hypothetical protein